MSRVVGKVDYGIFPAGPKTRASGLSVDALGIPAKSTSKMPAWFYLQWACGRTMMASWSVAMVGRRDSPRLWRRRGISAPRGSKCVINSAGYAHPILPTEFRSVSSSALTNMIGGPANSRSRARCVRSDTREVRENVA